MVIFNSYAKLPNGLLSLQLATDPAMKWGLEDWRSEIGMKSFQGLC